MTLPPLIAQAMLRALGTRASKPATGATTTAMGKSTKLLLTAAR